MITDFLKKILKGEDLTADESCLAMNCIMEGEATPAQIAALIIALKQKGEKASEVAGFVRSMRGHALKLEINDKNAVDGCGTGGDGAHTFNISTAAALVASSAGVTVAKHGNRSVSSKCGSADLLETLGGNIDPGPERVRDNINNIGFGFMMAPRFHPAMKHAAGPRRELGVRTIFNILGPMTNPAGVKRQLIGVYDPQLKSLMVDVLEMLGSEHIIVAHAKDGLDEFSVCAPTDFIELQNGKRSVQTLSPTDVGLEISQADALVGGDALKNCEILRRVLDGDLCACRDAVVLNAGVMIYLGGAADSIRDGVQDASAAIDSGEAKSRVEEWVKASVME